MDDRMDLSALDPSTDERRWEAMVQSIARRGSASRLQGGVLVQLVAWSRPALAMAAGLALGAWGIASFGGATPERSDPAYALASWAQGSELPSTGNILQILGGEDGSP